MIVAVPEECLSQIYMSLIVFHHLDIFLHFASEHYLLYPEHFRVHRIQDTLLLYNIVPSAQILFCQKLEESLQNISFCNIFFIKLISLSVRCAGRCPII